MRALDAASPLSAYQSIADLYDKLWGRASVEEFLPVVSRMLLPRLPEGSSILDLCCGTGRLAAALTRSGYRVTGLDLSPGMLRHARANAPEADFVVADVTSFAVGAGFHAAVSTFDSLNHLTSVAELAAAFECAARALERGGWFMFDLMTEDGMAQRHEDTFGLVGGDEVCFVRTTYAPGARRAIVDITVFDHDRVWRRLDVQLVQRIHGTEEVLDALATTGFVDVEVLDGEEDLGFERHAGRLFCLCRRQPGGPRHGPRHGPLRVPRRGVGEGRP